MIIDADDANADADEQDKEEDDHVEDVDVDDYGSLVISGGSAFNTVSYIRHFTHRGKPCSKEIVKK